MHMAIRARQLMRKSPRFSIAKISTRHAMRVGVIFNISCAALCAALGSCL